MVKILVLNSSPRGEKLSVTKTLLSYLIEGMSVSNAHIKLVNLYDKKIQNCTGCSNCNTVSPGKCCIKDDMTEELLPEFISSDVVVLGSPVYFGNVNAVMKTFIDRLYPFLDSRQEVLEGRHNHPYRGKMPSVVVVSAAGWHENVAFQFISSYFRHVFRGNIVGELYRGSSNTFMFCDSFREKREEIFEGARAAGREIAENGSISERISQIVSQPIEELEKVVDIYNMFISSCMYKKLNFSQWVETGRFIWPGSIRDFITMMSLSFNSEAANKENISIQFVFTGQVSGECYINVKEGKFEAAEGTRANPDVTITVPLEMWIEIMHGRLNSQQLLMQGKYSVRGDLAVLVKMGSVFNPNR
ncbi:MAG: Iron-sulfur flavoprotein [Firmicutes bacterium ADurb.Bin419]|nr:MAG: Iron-sulfur flavoprotein [Firmicutes bacterium ADurb.Bin419]